MRGRFDRPKESSSGEDLSVNKREEVAQLSAVSAARKVQLLTAQLSTESGSAAFQSVVVAIAQALDHALKLEYRAAEAAISLAQREKLEYMVKELRQTVIALEEALNEKGQRLLQSSVRPVAVEDSEFEPGENSESDWWFAISEAIQGLRDDTDRIRSLVKGQVKGTPMRQLAAITVRLLQRHRNDLLIEAERWMSS